MKINLKLSQINEVFRNILRIKTNFKIFGVQEFGTLFPPRCAHRAMTPCSKWARRIGGGSDHQCASQCPQAWVELGWVGAEGGAMRTSLNLRMLPEDSARENDASLKSALKG